MHAMHGMCISCSSSRLLFIGLTVESLLTLAFKPQQELFIDGDAQYTVFWVLPFVITRG
jgi:hypothetical protein